MALSTQRASSSSHALAEPPPHWKFDVFLSFRGEDTRRGFISHLYNKLQFCQLFKTFIDDRELEIGSEISPELLSAIEHSHLAIVVISPNYASSTWCLDELAKIIESMNSRDKRILPVFLNVDPSDVRYQENSFAEAFANHEVMFSNDPNKVERWRQALTKVANLSGYDVKNYRCESVLIEDIVKRVWEKVRPTITLYNSDEKLVGIDFRLGQMGLLLALEQKDVRFIGIWGMGGVGKTTLAQLVYEKTSYDFEVAKFLDVRKSNGQLVNLQKQVLFPVLKENVSQVFNDYEGTIFIKRCMRNKKVLLVVDDVDCCDLLKKLAGHKSWFGEGSRIIVTTRDQRLLTEHHIEISLELLQLNNSEALELFSHKAFGKDQPEEGFLELSKCFVDYAKGNPLALKTLGSSLYQRNTDEWNSMLNLLKRDPDPTIFKSLKLSYDALSGLQQKIFLDIAFFYIGMKKRRVTQLLEYCYGFNFVSVINALIEKSLLSIDHNYNVWMHGLVQEVAWKIVRDDSGDHDEPGRHSRLCHRHDIFRIFTTNTGTEAIKGIRLSLSELEEADSNWNFECFYKMLKLMFLEFDNLIVSSGPKFLPNTLIILRWNWYPSKSLPASFRPNLLAELKMQKGKFVKLWDGRQDLPKLKRMDLSVSKYLKKTPDFTGMPDLEDLDLKDCEGLVEVHPSIAVHKKLKWLKLYGCKNVKSFPSKIEMDSLKSLNLSYCSKLKIPEFGEGMQKLSYLCMPSTAIEELPSSIEHLVGLEVLDMSGCPKLKKLVENTGETECLKPFMRSKLGSLFRRKSLEPSLPSPRALPSLVSLDLTDCHLRQGVIPDDIGYCFPSLSHLWLGRNDFITLPASIKCLSKLHFIDLRGCKKFQQLPDLPSNNGLTVWADDCDSLKKLSEPSQQGTSSNLEFFRLTTVNCFGLIDNEGFTNGIFSMLRRLAAQGISPDFLSYRWIHSSFEIVSPGSRISEWFDIRSEGGSLTVELPPDRENCKSEWMGIVFCVVFADQREPHTLECNDFLIEGLSPGVGVKHIYASEKYSLHLTNLRHMMGDHLWVSFMPRGLIQETTSCSFTVSFDAYCSWIDRIPCSNCVKRCGARLLYEQDLKNLLNPPTDIMKQREAEAREEGPSKIASGVIAAREALTNMKLGDLDVPDGIHMWVYYPALHRDTENWGADANEFKPERFANGVSELCKYPQAYMPFGFGTRLCIGQTFAMLQLKIVLSLILSKFSFSLSPNYRHFPVYKMLLLPEHGIRLIVRRVQVLWFSSLRLTTCPLTLSSDGISLSIGRCEGDSMALQCGSMKEMDEAISYVGRSNSCWPVSNAA
ncbi:hypothetical protein ACLB2K_060998 [Fragaria x ananassa]